MNSLSWLLYLADVSDSIDWFFTLCTGLTAPGFLIWASVGFDGSDQCWSEADWATWRKIGFRLLLPTAVLGLLLGSLIPEKETVYAIAASQMGEKVAKSQSAEKAMKALNAWLDRQIIEPEPRQTKGN